MKQGATYVPCVDPLPLLLIDLERGVIKRYHRVLFAGSRPTMLKLTTWEVVLQGEAKFSKHRATWDTEQLEYLRAKGDWL